MKRLTEKQLTFAQEYLVDLNATAAARRAGYSPRTAKSQGQRLLTNADIRAVIDAGVRSRMERVEITQDRVLQELARIAFADIRRVVRSRGSEVTAVPPHELDDSTAAAIASVSTSEGRGNGLRVKLHDKLAALDKLGRHLGLFDGTQARTPEQIAQDIQSALQQIEDGMWEPQEDSGNS